MNIDIWETRFGFLDAIDQLVIFPIIMWIIKEEGV
jgi:hypothetical protein